MQPHTLRLVLGDQLNHHHSWWNDDPSTYTVLMCECLSETGYARHHVQKVVAFFVAMRAFARWLEEEKGAKVIYYTLDHAENRQSPSANVSALLATGQYTHWAYQWPDEYRLDQSLGALAASAPVPCIPADSEHFLTTRTDLLNHFKGKKMYLMESFYRMMRKRHKVLMQGDDPVEGKWNFDHDNRKSLAPGVSVPEPKVYPRDVADVVELLNKMQVHTMGTITAKRFLWPVTRSESLDMLEWFVAHCLRDFGAYQDAMSKGRWSLFHSRLSLAMNVKLLHPMEVIRAVEQAWREQPGTYSIQAVEGFIRQILGWREYMRGVYWARMPEYAKLNYFNHQGKLPAWYWTGETRMTCMREAVGQSLTHAYAHHIQRLMVTGNFALLAGVHPDEVDAWYLGVYIDAIEWVEITNTRGMSQHADGGIVGSKPYVSSANYIDKMSDYCKGCYYDKAKKTGERACPFNSLFWDFYHRHRDKLENHPRIGFVYRTWDKMGASSREGILAHAAHVLLHLDEL
jgi:deoxyribodipyrimidine photolyase-related protein